MRPNTTVQLETGKNLLSRYKTWAEVRRNSRVNKDGVLVVGELTPEEIARIIEKLK